MNKKRLLVVIISLFILPLSLFADTHAHYILGQIRKDIFFEVTILEEAIPFDLDSTLVQYNEDPESIATGIRIGTYRLISNSPRIELRVSHTSLKHLDTSLTENNEIGYRLYLMTGTDDNPTSFISTTGSEVVLDGSSVVQDGAVSLIDKNIYVTLDCGSLEATNNVLRSLESGMYQSTITFALWGESTT